MPGGIGTIHARAVALREKAVSDRRFYSERLLPFDAWEDDNGRIHYDRRSGDERRRAHEFAATLQTIRELDREPLVRCIREMGEELRARAERIEELLTINEGLHALLDASDYKARETSTESSALAS